MARSKKSAFALISALMLFIDWAANLFREVRRLGGNEQSIYDWFANKASFVETAKLIVKKTSSSLATLIAALKFDWVNSDITEEHFPSQPEDNGTEKEYKVFNFGKAISSENAIAEMDKDGYRPATLRELLIWGAKNWNGKDWVVALGSVWQDSHGDRGIPGLDWSDSGRGLHLHWFAIDWGEGYAFLAVRKF